MTVTHESLEWASRSTLVRGGVYLAEALRFFARTGEPPDLNSLVVDYKSWRESLSRAPLSQPLPWIAFSASRFLESRLDRADRVFEYGSGGSTLFLAARVSHVHSVEHDRSWSQELNARIGAMGIDNVTLALVEAGRDVEGGLTGDPADPGAYCSSDERFAGRNFRAYAQAIDGHPDESFDLVIIDGRARPSCFKHSLPKVAPGGLLILDNADRQHYRYVWETLASLKWKRMDFAGPVPYNRHFSKTSAWERPVDRSYTH